MPRARLRQHEGTLDLPGDFQLPMLLLALVVGHPKAAALLLPQFLDNARRERPFWAKPDEAAADDPLCATLRAQVEATATGARFRGGADLLRQWAPQVARFSFATAGMAAEPEPV